MKTPGRKVASARCQPCVERYAQSAPSPILMTSADEASSSSPLPGLPGSRSHHWKPGKLPTVFFINAAGATHHVSPRQFPRNKRCHQAVRQNDATSRWVTFDSSAKKTNDIGIIKSVELRALGDAHTHEKNGHSAENHRYPERSPKKRRALHYHVKNRRRKRKV